MSNGSVQFEFFNFKQGSSGNRDTEIRRDLIRILRERDPHTQLYRLQIIDTAVGGQGINKLISLLKAIHAEESDFIKQHWSVDVRLLHPTNGHENVPHMEATERKGDDRFKVKRASTDHHKHHRR